MYDRDARVCWTVQADLDELQKKHYERPYNVMPHVEPKQHDVCDSGENQQVAFASGLGVCDATPGLVVLGH